MAGHVVWVWWRRTVKCLQWAELTVWRDKLTFSLWTPCHVWERRQGQEVISNPLHNEAVSDFVYLNCLCRWFFFFLWRGKRKEAVIPLHWVQMSNGLSHFPLIFFFFFSNYNHRTLLCMAANWSIFATGRFTPLCASGQVEKKKVGSGESGSASGRQLPSVSVILVMFTPRAASCRRCAVLPTQTKPG